MKKCFVIGFIMALVPQVGAIAAQKTVDMLIAEKQAKMKKLESCKGTTKGLKIAGISTLGITAVGVAGNIAEAVVLNDYKDKVSKEKTELAKQQELQKSLKTQKEQDAARRQICEGFGGTYESSKKRCDKTITDKVNIEDVEKTILGLDANCKNIRFGGGEADKKPNYLADCEYDMTGSFVFSDLQCPDQKEFNWSNGTCVAKDGNTDGDKDEKKGNKGGAGSAQQCGDNQKLIDGECKDIENQQEATERELFDQACANAGYDPDGVVIGRCYVCPYEEKTAPVIRSKAYLDNALMTAARKMNVGCSGTIYTTQRQGGDFEDSNMDCVGGRIYCISRINKEATTKEQAKALLEDINNENEKKAKAKQVKIPFKPTEEQTEQQDPDPIFKPNVLKNMERAKEIINNDLPCKDDERFDYIMNVCVKK